MNDHLASQAAEVKAFEKGNCKPVAVGDGTEEGLTTVEWPV